MIFWYRNSFLASVVSIFGCVIAVGGISYIVDGNGVLAGVVMFVVGIVLAAIGKQISEDKSNKKWLKELQSKGLDGQVRASAEAANQLYNANPCDFTLKYIQSVNPAAAQQIAARTKK